MNHTAGAGTGPGSGRSRVWKSERKKLTNTMREDTRREGAVALGLLREAYDKAIHQHYEQCREAVIAC